MSDFDYGNARIHAMKSRLLSEREMEALLDVETLPGLIAALTKTAYRAPVEAALARVSGMDCIRAALHMDLASTLGKLRTFYTGEAGQLVEIALRSYDIHNLKAILRGLSKNVPPAEIVAALLPAGGLSYGTLVELAGAPEPRAAIDTLASLGLSFAQPLLALRARLPGAETDEMEVALDRWHFQQARQFLGAEASDGKLLVQSLNREADMANLLTVLRFARFRSERDLIHGPAGNRTDRADLSSLFCGPGQLSYALLATAGNRDSVQEAVEVFNGTLYEAPLAASLEAFGRSSLLSEFEKQLRHFHLMWSAGLIGKDPLGIGVVLGFLALKTNEVDNIRWITQGINLGFGAKLIREGIERIQ